MDNTLFIHDTDKLYSVLSESWDQAETSWEQLFVDDIDCSRINHIIITGLGGSAICGDILKNYLRDELKVPLIINRTYTLPAYTGSNTLVIASSYSGNTEETISALKSAIDKKCAIIVITTGGEITRIALENNIKIIRLREGFQPRFALYSSFFTILRLMQDLKFVKSQDRTVHEIIQSLRVKGKEYTTGNNIAFRTALDMKGYLPVIYSVTDFNDSAGKRFKGQLNENSKIHAWTAEYPEMNHNEIVGWETAKDSGIKYRTVILQDEEIPLRIKKRISIINNLLEGQKIGILTFEGKGASFKHRLIDIIYFCDWVSYYLALLNGKNPGEIDFIHHLKNRMSED